MARERCTPTMRHRWMTERTTEMKASYRGVNVVVISRSASVTMVQWQEVSTATLGAWVPGGAARTAMLWA